MSIRDVSNLPDDHPFVPEWVRQNRERAREERRKTCPVCQIHFPSAEECREHQREDHSS